MVPEALSEMLSHGSVVVLFGLLVVSGLGVPIPEDLVLLTGGALVHRGLVSLPTILAASAAGIVTGDLLLFRMAKRLGPAALERKLFRRLLPPRRRQRIERLFGKYGGFLVFFARHVAGLRAGVFAMAGIQGMSTARFLLFDGLGLWISAPLMLGLGYLFSDHLDLVRRDLARVEHFVILGVIAAFVGYTIVAVIRRQRVPALPGSEAEGPERSSSR